MNAMFEGWGDDAVRGYIVMLEEAEAHAITNKQAYERKLIEAKQELALREHRRALALTEVSGSSK